MLARSSGMWCSILCCSTRNASRFIRRRVDCSKGNVLRIKFVDPRNPFRLWDLGPGSLVAIRCERLKVFDSPCWNWYHGYHSSISFPQSWLSWRSSFWPCDDWPRFRWQSLRFVRNRIFWRFLSQCQRRYNSRCWYRKLFCHIEIN